MRALTEGARALAYVAASHCDVAHRHADSAVRAEHQALYEYLVPIVKGWSTERSIEVASLGVQVHGGMGFIEETGAAQYYRDARILTIYEGTTAIQANDLVGRKTLRDGGAVAKQFAGQIRATLEALSAHEGPAFAAMRLQLSAALQSFEAAVDFMLAHAKTDPTAVFAGSVPYLELAGTVLAGWQMARAMVAAARNEASDVPFYRAKIATARFFAEQILPRAAALESAIVSGKGGEGVYALSEDQF